MTIRPCALLLLVALTACSGGSNPTEPGSAPLPTGIAKATALQNLALIRTLQNQKKAGTLLVGLSAFGVGLDGRVRSGVAWEYSFSDRSGPSDIRYNWFVRDTGLIQEFDPVTATGPASGVDIGPSLLVDSDQALSIALETRGNDYLERFPDGIALIAYFHIAGQVQARITFRSFSDSCQVIVDVAAASGGVIFVDDRCLNSAP